MTFKLCAIFAALVFCTTSCGPDWNDCLACKPGEASAESSTGEQIPVVVNVEVNVNQTQGQNQTQSQTTNNVGDTTNNVGDGGTPPKDPPKTCRKVCTCTETRYVCKDGKDTSKKSDCKCGIKKTYTKCVKEETRCS